MKLVNDKSLLTVLSLSLLSSWFSVIPQTMAKPVEGKDHPKFGPPLKLDELLANGNTNKILNGENASAGDYPWFAMTVVNIGGVLYSGGCGGSLIASKWVLTAAHCVFDELISDGFVLVGALAPYGGTDNGGQFSEFVQVSKVYVNPDYDTIAFSNDFALLELAEDSAVNPVGFDSTGLSNGYSTGYGNLYVAGFGVTSPGGSGSTELLEVNLQYVSNSDCVGPSGPYLWPSEYIKDSMMCAADNNLNNGLVEATCQGDSGGPLYDSVSKTVVGLVSFGTGTDTSPICSDFLEFPTVFARVSYASTWMQQIMGTAPTPTAPTPSAPTPTAPTPTSTGCQDSSLRFRLFYNGRNIVRDCAWVGNRATVKRCELSGVPDICPVTCNNCDTCVDSSVRFKVLWNDRLITRDCIWVANKATVQRCNLKGVKEACCATCA